MFFSILERIVSNEIVRMDSYSGIVVRMDSYSIMEAECPKPKKGKREKREKQLRQEV